VNALDLERGDAGRDFRRDLLREEYEIAAVVELPGQRLRRRLEREREERPFVRRHLNLSGKAQIDFTGVEIASGSPERSTMRPRCAGTSISRL
jgi:hypothetical protein